MSRQQHTVRRQGDLARFLGAQLAKSMAQLALPMARRLPAWLVLGENSGAQLVGPGDELHAYRLSRKGLAPALLASEQGSDNIADFYRPAGQPADLMPGADEVLVYAHIQEVGSGKPRRWTATVAFGAKVPRPKVVEPDDEPVRGI